LPQCGSNRFCQEKIIVIADNIQTVADVNGTIYELEVLAGGEGGQGVVYLVRGGKLAVKLLKNTSSENRESLRVKLEEVRRLPLEDLLLAKPLQMLAKPRVGYVMELFTEMESLSKLIFPGKNKNPLEYYIQTGGLKRRLRILAKVADTLSKMHSRSLVYGDPSPNNIFISEDPKYSEIRLIDADNICYTTQRGQQVVYTPRYGAPEVVLGKSTVNTLTDTYAFAVILFEALTFIHPLLGDHIIDGSPDLEEKAFQGQYPWIEDTQDTSNKTIRGLERENVLSPGLMQLCKETFGEGLLEPTKRPGIQKWVDALFSAYDNTISCPSCLGTYYRDKRECPWCSDADDPQPIPYHILCLIGRWEPDSVSNKLIKKPVMIKSEATQQPGAAGTLTLQVNQSIVVTKRIADIDRSNEMHEPKVKIMLKESEGNHFIKVRAALGHKVWVSDQDGEGFEVIREEWVKIKYSQILHFGPQTRPHRIIYFGSGMAP
jgi:eukaryotic-like serine/threonine-protein kinase